MVNYDPPTSAAQYVHRAGRTGRQGAAGLVVSLLKRDAASKHLAVQVRGMLQRARTPMPAALLALLPAPAEAPAEPAQEQPAKLEGRRGSAAAAAGGKLAGGKLAGGKRRREGKKSEGKKKRREAADAEVDSGGAHDGGSDGGNGTLGGLSDLMSFAQAAAGGIG